MPPHGLPWSDDVLWRHKSRPQSSTLRGKSRLESLSRTTAEREGSCESPTLQPPPPLSAALALDPATSPAVLWQIAKSRPDLRRWLVANPSATPELLEYVSQIGGPWVRESLEILLADYEGALTSPPSHERLK